VKLLGQHDQSVAIGNLVAGGEEVELSRESHVEVPHAQLILNARVATAPEQLEMMVRDTLAAVAGAETIAIEVGTLRSFRPGRPVPTHRMSNE
jgi:hypothetical protein